MAPTRATAQMLVNLLAASHVATLESLPALLREYTPQAGLEHVHIYLSDLREETLREMTGEGLDAAEAGEQLHIESTVAGRVFQSLQILPGGGENGRRYWIPLLDGTERLGVLSVGLRTEPDDETRTAMTALASLVGLLMVSKRAHSDSYARLTRSQPMSVSAEMQWTLMPPRTFAGPRVTVAAAMEPAYSTAGDAFDYALADDTVHLAVFDAMGHDTAAGLTANLAMATCRNQRRQGAGLEQARDAIESMLLEQFTRERYATAILADLDLRSGLLSWINCGHPPPILIRAGRWITALERRPTHPLGTDLGLPVEIHREQLEPGDRIICYTDGIIEARDRSGREFGLDRFVQFIIRHEADGFPVPETLRRLVHAVLDHHDGRLGDDATVLLCEWHGHHLPPLAEALGPLART